MFDLEGEVLEIAVSVGDAFEQLDLVVDTLEFAGVDPVLAVIHDPFAVTLKGFGKSK